jgi:hypothetical protein
MSGAMTDLELILTRESPLTLRAPGPDDAMTGHAA